jgi:exopolysaccharide production protein ExoZ
LDAVSDESPQPALRVRGTRQPIVQNAQVLRFFAALSVLVGHAQHEAIDLGTGLRTIWQPIPWRFGVDIFFVISGFVMYHTASSRFGKAGAARDYLLRRIIRIVPTYWFFTVLALAAAAVFGRVMNTSHWRVSDIIASFAFIPWRQADGQVTPILNLGWTLNYEMFFYVAFALALTLPRRSGLLAIFAAFIALAAFYPIVPSQWFALKFWSNPIIVEFLFGIVIALVSERGGRIRPPIALLCVIAALALSAQFPQEPDLRWLFWGLPAAMIGASAILLPQPSQGRCLSLLSMAGGASYALYLSHPFTVNLVGLVWRALFADRWPVGYLITVILTAIGVSFIFYLLVERPLTAFLKARFQNGGPRIRAA